MAHEFDQSDRLLQVELPFPDPKLLLRRFSGREECSRLFEFQLELVDADVEEKLDLEAVLKPEKILGKLIKFQVSCGDPEPRYFNGIVKRFGSVGASPREAVYVAEIVPWAWMMTLHVQSRIFQEMSSEDIIKQVISDGGYCTDYKFDTKKTFAMREYCVQYRESDFDFVQRLLEEEGCGYHWEFEESKHTMVFSDENPVGDVRAFRFSTQPEVLNEFTLFQESFQLHTGKWFSKAWNPLEATTVKASDKSITKFLSPIAKGSELYEHDGARVSETAIPDALKSLGTARLEHMEARATTYRGTSSIPSLSLASQFKLSDHEYFEGKSYQALWVDHLCEDTGLFPGDHSQTSYENAFECILSKVPRPPSRITRKARIDGIQTAIVVGPKGDEIYTDAHGRVKVAFHWDRESKQDEKSSCWVRVAQAWAGDKFGIYFHPRIGQEVIVSFLNGDPDRPLITGRVFNGKNKYPYPLPDEKEKSGIKTFSTVKGKTKNFNELRFTDSLEKEEIYIHAERDFNTVVENDQTLKVGFDHKDKGDQTIDIFNDRKLTIEKGVHEITVKTGDQTIKIDKGNWDNVVGKGDFTLKVSAGSVLIEAKTFIELKCGKSSIKLEPTKITLKVMQTKMVFEPTKAALKSLMVDIAGGAKTSIKAPMTDVKGDAMLKMKGGVVMIN